MDKSPGVTFIDTSTETKALLAKLAKSALRESGKVVRKTLRDTVPVRSKRFKNHIASWVFIDKRTGQPQMQIGFYGWQRVRKRGKLPSHASPHWIEEGTRPHDITARRAKTMMYGEDVYGHKVNHPGQRATHVLRNSVYNNIDAIRGAQEQFLAELNKTLEAAGAKVYTGEEEESE